MGEPEQSTSGARPDQFWRKVLLLKNGDFTKIGDQVCVPTHSEMATIRARIGQYKREIEFNASMSSDMVRRKLEEVFPYLRNKGFFCAAKSNLNSDVSQFDLHGSRHVWNGKTIRRKIKGNSALYILEDDEMDSSGISGSDPDTTQEDSLIQWLRDVGNLEISINPAESPLEGGAPCRFTFNPRLHSEVTSGHATFKNIYEVTVPLERLGDGSLTGIIPASPRAGLVSVTLASQHGIDLGQTNIKYYGPKEVLKTIVHSPLLVKELCEEFSMVYGFGETDMEAINSRILGISDPMQLFRLLVYTAAEVGAQQFIEIIFNSSAGRVVFETYRGSAQLPEVVARDHGNEETAQYLECITKRFSDEIRSGKECSQTIDWSELAKAAEAAQKKLDLTNQKEDSLEKRNDPKETGYLGDANSSSSEASAPQSSDSEDDISVRTKPKAMAITTTMTTRKASPVPEETANYLKNVTKREQLPNMDQSTGGAVLRKPAGQFNRNVLLLKNDNFRRIDGQFYMPMESEISTIIRCSQLGQFRKGVKFCVSMSEDAVKKKLQETFPYLENACFVCAAVVKLDKERKRFEFYGPPRLWNGKTIKKSIRGNSTLYILEDEVPDSETELNAIEILQGGDDVMGNIATNINQMSLLHDPQMEIDENHQASPVPEETANYLENVTKRFSEETTTRKECSQTIDWSKLVKAAEAAQKQFDPTGKKDDKIPKDIPKETGYLGDIDILSSESSEGQGSDSDDDI